MVCLLGLSIGLLVHQISQDVPFILRRFFWHLSYLFIVAACLPLLFGRERGLFTPLELWRGPFGLSGTCGPEHTYSDFSV